MATPDQKVLAALPRADVAGLAALWPKPSPGLVMKLVDAVHVVSLRHWPDDGSAVIAAVLTAHGLSPLPAPGRALSSEHLLVWKSPNETLMLTQDAARAASLLAALRPMPGALACAIDLSSGSLVVQLSGLRLDALLSRLVDAQALPRDVGQASRMKLADVAAVVWREAPDRVGLLVDRANDHYLARWLSYAADAL